jgi:cutinase
VKTYPVAYAAKIETNVSTQRTDNASIAKAITAFKSASGCKVIIAGGYSQGAAVMVRSVPKLDEGLKKKIAAVALFGSTLNKQYNGGIPGFPTDRAKTWCNKSKLEHSLFNFRLMLTYLRR